MKKLLLAILAEKSYSMRFAEYLNRHKNMFMELTIFTSIEKIEEFCKNNIIDILLVGDNEVCLESLCAGIKKIILLSDGNIVCEKSKHPVIFKYQSADVILRELLTIIAEDEELSDITTNVKSKNTKIISVFSSFAGAGVSSFAWNKCKESSAFQKTLYVNLELFDGFGEFCEGTDNKRAYIRGMSEIVFYLKQEGRKLSVKLESLVRQRDGIYYILPVEDYKDLYSISVKEMKKFIEIIADETIYENIVFDVGYISDAVISLLEISDDIYMPKPLTCVQQNKLNSFYRILERTEKDKLRDIIKYYDENLCEVMI